MIGLYRADSGTYRDVASQAGVGAPSRDRLGFGCRFVDLDLDGRLDLVVSNGHIDDTVRHIRGTPGHAQPPQLFLNVGNGSFRESASAVGASFAQARVGRGLASGDFDGDGDVDLLMTTNNGPALLFRNDHTAGNRSVRMRLIGTKSNRDAIGASVRVIAGAQRSRAGSDGSDNLAVGAAVTLVSAAATSGTHRRHLAERPDESSRRGERTHLECIEGRTIAIVVQNFAIGSARVTLSRQ